MASARPRESKSAFWRSSEPEANGVSMASARPRESKAVRKAVPVLGLLKVSMASARPRESKWAVSPVSADEADVSMASARPRESKGWCYKCLENKGLESRIYRTLPKEGGIGRESF
jgi:hypothetical protein